MSVGLKDVACACPRPSLGGGGGGVKFRTCPGAVFHRKGRRSVPQNNSSLSMIGRWLPMRHIDGGRRGSSCKSLSSLV
eukprot:4257504-Amphidinium_carterae.1